MLNYSQKNRKLSTKQISLIAMLGAISGVLMIFEFPLPLVPTFLKMDFSDLPVVLGGCLIGPLSGVFISIIKIALSLLLHGTTTMGIGEVSNLILTISYMLPISIFWKKKTFKNTNFIPLIMGIFTVSFIAIISNVYLMFPLYAKFYGMDINAIVAMGTVTNPYVKNLFSLVVLGLLPFNIFKYGVISILFSSIYRSFKRIFI